jgi:hypothetical protein
MLFALMNGSSLSVFLRAGLARQPGARTMMAGCRWSVGGPRFVDGTHAFSSPYPGFNLLTILSFYAWLCSYRNTVILRRVCATSLDPKKPHLAWREYSSSVLEIWSCLEPLSSSHHCPRGLAFSGHCRRSGFSCSAAGPGLCGLLLCSCCNFSAIRHAPSRKMRTPCCPRPMVVSSSWRRRMIRMPTASR